MKTQIKKTNQILTPLQLQWIEMIKNQLGKPIGIKVYNPHLKEYIYPIHTKGSIKCLLKMIPTDEVIHQYIQKVQILKKLNQII